jgi:hypothetical protein
LPEKALTVTIRLSRPQVNLHHFWDLTGRDFYCIQISD